MIKLKYYPYELRYSEVFAVSSHARTSTEIIYIELEYEGITGYGEASFPPYLKEKRSDNLEYLSLLNFDSLSAPFSISEIHKTLDSVSMENSPAKAAIDMAFYDLMGKIAGIPVYECFGLENSKRIYTSFTIGIGEDDFVVRQLKKAENFEMLKVKLGNDMDYNKRVITLIRNQSGHRIGVDFNQAINNKEEAMEMLDWLAAREVEYAEQPMPVTMEHDYLWLKSGSPVELYGDESIQTASDIMNKKDLFHGVNVKLMKCGGISKAYEQYKIAKSLGLKTMIGCMAESACAIAAAAQISSLFDRIDLDGQMFVTNPVFTGISVETGEIVFSGETGLGLKKI